jgi:hypothetical protein
VSRLVDQLFLDHPHTVGESYGQHLRHALGFALTLLGAGAQCLLHAFVPGLCERSASRKVAALIERMRRVPLQSGRPATPHPGQ